MAQSTTSGSLAGWYRQRIGEPSNPEEVSGYWLFAVGVVLGTIGILGFLFTTGAGMLRQWSISAAAAGLALAIAGPVLRLPLRRSARLFVYAGLALCAGAIAWFIAVYPQSWSLSTGRSTVIALFATGVVAIALGGVLIPLITPRTSDPHTPSSTKTSPTGSQDRTVSEDLRGQLAALHKSSARFELFEDGTGEWRWRLRHRNGNLIADGGQGYTRQHNAVKGLESVRRNALGAEVLLVPSDEPTPDPGVEFKLVHRVDPQASFQLFEDKAGEHRWRLVHDNGNVLADSGEGYRRRGGAENGIEAVRKLAGEASYLRPDPTAFEVYRDEAGQWRWRMVHRNGNILADGGQGYTRHHDARRAIKRLKETAPDLEPEIYEDKAGEHRWRLVHGNGNVLADSGEGYSSASKAREAGQSFPKHVPEAHLLDVHHGVFEVYEDKAGEWRWRLRHRNGNIVADGGEGYAERNKAWKAIEGVKRNAPNAPLEKAPEQPA